VRSYSNEFREKILRQVLPPNAKTFAQASKDSGVPKSTIAHWKFTYRRRGSVVAKESLNPKDWSGEKKLSVIIETAALNEQELSEYCRKKGLYPEQIERWKQAAIAGNEKPEKLSKREKKELNKEVHKNRRLEKEIRRKDKALAEASALLILKKKAQVIWGDDEEE